MKKSGLDHTSISKVRPDIIYYSSSQLGQTGAYSSYVGYGYQASAMAGFTYITGWADQMPMLYHGAYTDFTACRFGAAAIMAALDYRRRTGRGIYIDQSQMESVLHLIEPLIMDYTINQRVAERCGNRVPWAAPHGIYPCKTNDTWCSICISTDAEWQAFCQKVNDSWISNQRFRTMVDRKKNEDELDVLIADWTSKYEAPEIEKMLQAVGVAANVVNSVKTLVEEDDQVKHRGYFRKYKHSVIGEHLYRGPAFKLSKNVDGQFAGPALGEHNEFVFKELLGLSDEEIAEALIAGGITTEHDATSDIKATF
jgi:benzylsuccinate CoA-transferase BbsF subunit